MNLVALIIVLICSINYTESIDVEEIETNNTMNNGGGLGAVNRYVVADNESLGQDRINVAALGDNSNGLNTAFGVVPGVGSSMDIYSNNMGFGQPNGISGNNFGSGMSSNIFPGYGYGMFPNMFPGMNFPGTNGYGYFPGNGFGNNPFSGINPGNGFGNNPYSPINPGYGYGMNPGYGNQPGMGYGYGNWNSNFNGVSNPFGMGASPWFRKAPAENSSTT